MPNSEVNPKDLTAGALYAPVNNVVQLFDGSTPRRQKDRLSAAIQHIERIAYECGRIADRVESRRANVEPLFDPEAQRIASLRALCAEVDAWEPLSAGGSEPESVKTLVDECYASAAEWERRANGSRAREAELRARLAAKRGAETL